MKKKSLKSLFLNCTYKQTQPVQEFHNFCISSQFFFKSLFS